MLGLPLVLLKRFLFFATLLIPTAVFGQSVTYQDRLIGQRALGMGGAFTGIADDPTASYYNPAGLTNLHQLQLEVGLPILGFEYQRIRGGLVTQGNDKKDLNAFSVLAYPTTVGAAAGLGFKDENNREIIVVSATLLIPWQRNTALRQTLQDQSLNAFSLLQENEQTLLIGPGIAFRVGIVSLGLSVYYTHSNMASISSRLITAPDGTATAVTSVVEGWTGGINPRVGIMLQPSPRWSFGLMGSLSSHRIWGDGSVRVAGIAAQPDQPLQQALYNIEGARLDLPLPWEIRVGAGFSPTPKLTIAADISTYMPQRFNLFQASVDEGLTNISVSVKRNFVMNGNLGVEYIIRDGLLVRFGAFTNLTAASRPAPECDTISCTDYINSGGVTASVGFALWKVMLDLGINASAGLGSVQQFIGPNQFVWSQYERYAVQLFIGGNLGKIINSTAEQLKQVIEKGGLIKP